MVLVLKEVEKILGDGQASVIDAVVESQLVGKPRDKELKGTKSWSTNCLIRLYHSRSSLKKETKLPDFLVLLKQSEDVTKALALVNARIEDSGYLTFIDMEKEAEE